MGQIPRGWPIREAPCPREGGAAEPAAWGPCGAPHGGWPATPSTFSPTFPSQGTFPTWTAIYSDAHERENGRRKIQSFLSQFSLPISCGFAKKRARGELTPPHHHTPSCYWDPDPKRSTSAISAGSEIRESSSYTVRVRVLGGATTCGTGRRARTIATLRSSSLNDYFIHVS